LKNKLKIPIVLTEIFLLFLIIMGSYSTHSAYKINGWSWNVTSIINDVEVTSETSILSNILFLIFLSWINALIFIMLNYINNCEKELAS